jgi:putative SOS response-associated peptidase YedK
MCGRVSQEMSAESVARLFQAELLPEGSPDLGARYNVAPTQPVLAVVSDEGKRRVVQHRWGLIPSWAKDPTAFAGKTFNARAETVAAKPSYRDSFRRRRSLVPVGAFYEWRRTDGSRQPYAIVRQDGKPLALAGLWAPWRGPGSDAELRTCAVITTSANEVVGELHDRMPVILPEDAWDQWLDPEYQDTAELEKLLRPFPSELIRAYPISRAVGNTRNDGPELLRAIA